MRKQGDLVGGRYRIERLLGQGGMGTVFLATHLRIGDQVAVKTLRPAFAEDDAVREHFLREPQSAARIRHPNIIGVRDADDDENGIPYLVMDYVEGADLGSLIEQQLRLEPQRVLAILEQAAGALDAAHAAGIVHRDVKPANILVRSDGHVYVTDFGIAKDLAAPAITRKDDFLGTLPYSPPEQIRNRGVDSRSDVYALTCVLYHCLVGAPPFDRDTDYDVMKAQIEEPPPRPSLDDPLLEPFDSLIAIGMAKDKDDRFETCGALLEAAAEALRLATTPAAAPPDESSGAHMRPFPDGATVLDLEATSLDTDQAQIVLPREDVAGTLEPVATATAEAANGDQVVEEPRRIEKPVVPPVTPLPVTAERAGRALPPTRLATANPPTPAGGTPATIVDSSADVTKTKAPRRSGITAAVVLVGGTAVLIAGILLHNGGGTPTVSNLPRARADVISVGGEQQYSIPTNRLTDNDRGTSLRVVGLAGSRRSLHGSLRLDRGHTHVSYIADAAFTGTARFTYTARDADGHLAVGTVRLHVKALTSSQTRLLSYVPSSIRPSCGAGAGSPTGSLASLACSSTVGNVAFSSYASGRLAVRAFQANYRNQSGDCSKGSATGTWSWVQTPKVQQGRYGCDIISGRARFGWTYTGGRYYAQVIGGRKATTGSLNRWFFALRLRR